MNNKNLSELSRRLTPKKLAHGTWYSQGTIINLNDDYCNYEKISIRTGWNSENGGLYDHELIINKNNETSLNQLVHCYQGDGKHLGAITINYDPKYPRQIKIIKSNGLTSDNAAQGIREVWGLL